MGQPSASPSPNLSQQEVHPLLVTPFKPLQFEPLLCFGPALRVPWRPMPRARDPTHHDPTRCYRMGGSGLLCEPAGSEGYGAANSHGVLSQAQGMSDLESGWAATLEWRQLVPPGGREVVVQVPQDLPSQSWLQWRVPGEVWHGQLLCQLQLITLPGKVHVLEQLCVLCCVAYSFAGRNTQQAVAQNLLKVWEHQLI